MIEPLTTIGLLATAFSAGVSARGLERRQGITYPTVSTAFGGEPSVPTGTVSVSDGPSETLSTTTQLPLPIPTDLGQYINATQQNGTNSSVVLDLSVNGGGRNKTAPLLYGWMIEDINHSVDGN